MKTNHLSLACCVHMVTVLFQLDNLSNVEKMCNMFSFDQLDNPPSAAMMKLVLSYKSATSSSVQLNSTSASVKIGQMERKTFSVFSRWLVVIADSLTMSWVRGKQEHTTQHSVL